MAQLRQDYNEFTRRSTAILVVGPEKQAVFHEFWSTHDLPFVGLPDPDHRVAKLYGQQVKLLKAGRMPALVLVDKAGLVRYCHYASSMSDIPENQAVLAFIDRINRESTPSLESSPAP